MLRRSRLGRFIRRSLYRTKRAARLNIGKAESQAALERMHRRRCNR